MYSLRRTWAARFLLLAVVGTLLVAESSSFEQDMEPFLGTWKMESSQNYAEYLRAIGLDFTTIKLIENVKLTDIFVAEPDGSYRLRVEVPFRSSEVKFRLNEEFDSLFVGRKTKSTFRLENGKLIQDQRGDVKSVITRELTDYNTLVATITANGVTATRVFKRE